MNLVLNKFEKSIDNKSFFHYSNFVCNNIDFLYELTFLMIDKLYDINNLEIPEEDNYQALSIDNSIDLAQKFCNKYNILVDINKLISDKKLVFTGEYKLTLDLEKDPKYSGESSYDDSKGKIIAMPITNTTHDAFSLVHELVHYSNQPNNGYRNETSDLLTEAVSFAYELIFCMELDKKYEESKDLHFKLFERIITSHCRIVLDAYAAVYLYNKTGGLTRKHYKKIYDSDDYDILINNLISYIEEDRDLFYDSWYIIGFPLAIYMLDKHQKDNSFIEKIKQLNDSINDKSLMDCLNIIEIKNLDDMLKKSDNSLDYYVKLLKDKYEVKGKSL